MDDNSTEPSSYSSRTNAFATLRDKIYIHKLPSYGNKIFYGLGFLALTSLALLAVTGVTLAFMGQNWWLTNPWGVYTRSIHLWSVQALIAILILHMLVGFTTSGFKAPRRMTWVFGALILCLALIQTEFGYGLRGDFSSQFRAVSGADFWNGAFLGYWVNPLSHLQEFALHVAIIPLAILLLFIMHFILVRTYGIAKPYRNDIKYKMVAADHRIMYIRGGVLVAAVLVLAFFFHSPYVPAIRIADAARQNPNGVAQNFLDEFNRTSDTATYLDSIDPYAFDTRQVFVVTPYETLIGASGASDAWHAFENAPPAAQTQYLAQADEYYSNGGTTLGMATGTAASVSMNPVISIISTLMPAAANGTYEKLLDGADPSPETYSLRFLNDMDVFEQKAETLNMDTAEWGMAKDETGSVWALPPGSWWLTPLGMVNSAFDLLDNPNGDRDGAEILGLLMLIFIMFPYIPYLNRLPELFRLAPVIWKTKDESDLQPPTLRPRKLP
ncbi:MAG TPA: cytochrome b N-terminal domain-containing protein [Candidatus Paceibacterota bacterium]|nr:cytochrome b N-terminal domain-containing protein [Candidatus Paceibacterota bacterium]